MRLKRLIAIVLTGLFLSAAFPHISSSAASNPVIMVNNSKLVSDTLPQYDNGIVMVPALELAKSLGGSFTFSSRDMSGAITVGSNELLYHLDNNIAAYDGKNLTAEAPMKITGLRFMVPAKFTSAKLGAECYTHYTKKQIMIFQPVNGKLVYKVQPGDTLWIISQTFGVSISSIKTNNNLTSDMIYIDQKLIIKDIASAAAKIDAKIISSATLRSGAGFGYSEVNYLSAGTAVTVTGKTGDWYGVNTAKGPGFVYYTTISVTQDVTYVKNSTSYFAGKIPWDTSMDTVTYQDYTVVSGDSIWSIALNHSIQDYELAAANNMSVNAILYPAQIIKIPVHNIPVKTTPGAQYGEVLDWFSEAQYVFPIGKTGKLTDIATGKSFMVKRTMGANHSDTETLTAQDSEIMKDIFGGSWIWTRRQFILEVDGRRIAVSVAGMPHAGVDGVPYLQNVDNRSDNYGYGPNYDSISGNGMNGHFDMYFLNCLRHVDNLIDEAHQYNVLAAGGLR